MVLVKATGTSFMVTTQQRAERCCPAPTSWPCWCATWARCRPARSLPLNPRLAPDELRYFLADSGSKVAVIGEGHLHLAEALRSELPELHTVVSDTALGQAPVDKHRPIRVAAEDPCFLFYSSGTTGWPKGVVHTHVNVASALGGAADLLAGRARRRCGQRPAPVPRPRALLRHSPLSAGRRLPTDRRLLLPGWWSGRSAG